MACTTAIPPLTGFSVVPDINMTDSVYCAAVLTYYSELGVFIAQTNNTLIWMKTTAEAACTARDEARAAAVNAALQVTLAANQVTLAANQVTLASNFADEAATSANAAENSAIASHNSAIEALESAGVAAAAAGLNFGGFYVLDGDLHAEYNDLEITAIQIIDGEFIVELD